MERMPKRRTLFIGWNLEAQLSNDEFTFKPPAGGRLTSMNAVIRP
jgi:hypothetical protein